MNPLKNRRTGKGVFTAALILAGSLRADDASVSALVTPVPSGFYTVTPCRAVDTRIGLGPNGGPALGGRRGPRLRDHRPLRRSEQRPRRRAEPDGRESRRPQGPSSSTPPANRSRWRRRSTSPPGKTRANNAIAATGAGGPGRPPTAACRPGRRSTSSSTSSGTSRTPPATSRPSSSRAPTARSRCRRTAVAALGELLRRRPAGRRAVHRGVERDDRPVGRLVLRAGRPEHQRDFRRRRDVHAPPHRERLGPRGLRRADGEGDRDDAGRPAVPRPGLVRPAPGPVGNRPDAGPLRVDRGAVPRAGDPAYPALPPESGTAPADCTYNTVCYRDKYTTYSAAEPLLHERPLRRTTRFGRRSRGRSTRSSSSRETTSRCRAGSPRT